MKGNSGKAKSAYLGIDDRVPVRVGKINAKTIKSQYENLIFLKEYIRRIMRARVIVSSKSGIQNAELVGVTVVRIFI